MPRARDAARVSRGLLVSGVFFGGRCALPKWQAHSHVVRCFQATARGACLYYSANWIFNVAGTLLCAVRT